MFGVWETLIDVDKNQTIKNMDMGFGEEIVKIIRNKATCKLPVALGDILVENICDDANLIVTGNF